MKRNSNNNEPLMNYYTFYIEAGFFFHFPKVPTIYCKLVQCVRERSFKV